MELKVREKTSACLPQRTEQTSKHRNGVHLPRRKNKVHKSLLYKLIIANWLLSFLLLAYNGNSLALTLFVGVYFAIACMLIVRNRKGVGRLVRKLDLLTDKYVDMHTNTHKG